MCEYFRHRRSLKYPQCFFLLTLNSFWSVFQSLAQLEILCKQLYETTDTTTRLQAEKALVEFTNSPDCLSKCQLLLESGSVRMKLFVNWEEQYIYIDLTAVFCPLV